MPERLDLDVDYRIREMVEQEAAKRTRRLERENRALQLQQIQQALGTGASFLGQRGGALGQGDLLQLLLGLY